MHFLCKTKKNASKEALPPKGLIKICRIFRREFFRPEKIPTQPVYNDQKLKRKL